MAGGRPRVVIIGAGFAGLWAARQLARASVDVLLVDRYNYHTFLPLLYQVAAAELEPEEIAYPVRSILRRLPAVQFLMAEVRGLDLTTHVVETTEGTVPYDFLIIAAGSTSHFFDVDGAGEYAFPLKTLEQAVVLRSHVLICFERAVHEADAERRRRALTFTIVGGGPTGVEFAGALAELVRGPLARDYPALDLREVRVVVVELMDTLLPGLPQRLCEYALARLRYMGVEVILGGRVRSVTPQALGLQDGSAIPTDTVVWTAGVRSVPAEDAWALPLTRGGRIQVLPTLQCPGHPDVYAAGDAAYLELDGRSLPMIAPAAIQQGVAAARNIRRQLRGVPPAPFRYRDRGTLVTIGRNAAVADVGGRAVTGFPAWVLWLGVHLVNLIGFRNRLFVLVNWAWDYLFFERAVRLIIPAARVPVRDREPTPR